MSGPPKDPKRRALPVADWPAPDRVAWEAACVPGSLFHAPGAAASKAPETRAAWAGAYSRFLTWLVDTQRSDRDRGLRGHLSAANLEPYVDWLRPRVASLSLWSEMNCLYRFACAVTPDLKPSLDWLRVAVNRLHAVARPKTSILDRLEHPRRLIRAGVDLMDAVDRAERMVSWKRAARYRDGLMLVLEGFRGLRLRNLTDITIGTNLLRTTDCYVLRYTHQETKTRRWREWPIPRQLTLRIERYLSVYRPILLKGNESSRFWINKDGNPFDKHGIFGRFKKVTLRLLGKPLTTRIVRHMTATTIDDELPSHSKMIAPLLGHTQLETAERYYMSQRMRTAVRSHVKNLRLIQAELSVDREPRPLKSAPHRCGSRQR